MFNFIKNIFGNKHEKDVKGYAAVVDKTNAYYAEYQNISNDQLRNKTLEFRERIKLGLSDIDNDIHALTEKANEEPDFIKKEEIYNEVDNIRKERNKYLENVLKEILPEAFAVVKETARRFKDNSTLR